MAFIEALRPVPTRGFTWSILDGLSSTGETECYLAYVFDPDRAPNSILLDQKLDKSFLFPYMEILLASRFLFVRPSSAGTMLEGSTSHITMIC